MFADERISKLDFDFVHFLVSEGKTFDLYEIYISITTGDLDMIELVTENSRYGIDKYANEIFSSGNIEVVEHFREDVIVYADVDLPSVVEHNSLEFLEYVLETGLYVITDMDDLLISFHVTYDTEKIKVVHKFTPEEWIDHSTVMKYCFENCNCETWEHFYGDIEFGEIYVLFLTFTWHFEDKYDNEKRNAFNILEHITHTREFTEEEHDKICGMATRKKLYDVVQGGIASGDFVKFVKFGNY